MATDWLAAYNVADALLACVCEALDLVPVDVPTLEGCPSRACVTVANTAWENCDCGGELIVAVERVYATDDFPNEDRSTSSADCYPQALAADLVVRILRCACVSDDESAPTCECRATKAQQQMADAAATLAGIMCCFDDDDDETLWVFGGSTPIGPAGGCVGVETRLTVDLAVCPCDQ